MSESGIRRLVHAAYEQEAAVHCDVGLYADERIRNFFAQVKTIMNETFHSLHDSLQQYPDVERTKRLAKGLAFLASEENQATSQDEIARATQEFPTIPQEYYRAMVRFAQCMVSKKQGIKVEATPFETFLFKMYRRMAMSTEVRSGRYFAMSYMEQEIFLKDMMRMTMGACLTVKQVEEPASAAASVSASGASGTSGRDRANPVLPSDSVSNIMPNLTGGRPKPRAAASTALENALSVATEEEPSLTVFSLTEHKARLAQKQETAAAPKSKPLKTPSVLSRKHYGDSTVEKEVEIEVYSRTGPGAGHGGGHGGGGAPPQLVGPPSLMGGRHKPAYSTFYEGDTKTPRGTSGSPSDFLFDDDHSSSATE